MRKLLSCFLSASLCIGFCVGLTACDEKEPPQGTEQPGVTEGISREDWQEAFSESNYENVTVRYAVVSGNTAQYVVKIAEGEVYRSARFGESFHAQLFTKETAVEQKNMFLSLLFALTNEKDSFVYDAEQGVYVSQQKIVTYPYESVVAEMENSKVKFDSDGNLIAFTCLFTECRDGVAVETSALNTEWTFCDYGTTVITAEDRAAAEANA